MPRLKQIFDRDYKIRFFSIVSVLVLVANIMIINIGNFGLFKISRPLFLGLMIAMYVVIAKKHIKLFLLTQCLFFVGEVIQFNFENLFSVSLSLFTLGVISLDKIFLSYLKNINGSRFLGYFSFFLLLFVVVFFYVLDKSVNKIVVLAYGITFVLLISLALLVFLKRMNRANLLLFASMVFAGISNSIMSINISKIVLDKPILLATTILFFCTHYSMCLGFIKKEELSKKTLF